MTRRSGEVWNVIAVNSSVVYENGAYKMRRRPSPPDGDEEKILFLCDSKAHAEEQILGIRRTLAEASIVRRHLRVSSGADEMEVLRKINFCEITV